MSAVIQFIACYIALFPEKLNITVYKTIVLPVTLLYEGETSSLTLRVG